MEAYCSFKTLANGPCGHGKKSSSEIISLVSCTKSIDAHLSAHKFSGLVDELDLRGTDRSLRPRGGGGGGGGAVVF